MLKALYDYAVKNDLALPPGFVNKSIRAYILLAEDGHYLGIEQCENEELPARILAAWLTVRINAISWQKS